MPTGYAYLTIPTDDKSLTTDYRLTLEHENVVRIEVLIVPYHTGRLQVRMLWEQGELPTVAADRVLAAWWWRCGRC